MATMQDLVQTMLQGQQLLLAKRAQEVSEANSKASRLAALTQMAEGIADPKLRKALVKTGVDWQLGDEKTVEGILNNVAPASGTVQRIYEQMGLLQGEATGENPERGRQAATRAATGAGTAGMAQNKLAEKLLTAATQQTDISPGWNETLARGLAANMFTNMDPGRLALSTSMANLPQEILTRGAERQVGEIPTWDQLAGNQLGWGQVAAGSALGEAKLGVDWKIAQLDNATRRMIAGMQRDAAGGASNAASLNTLFGMLSTSMTLLQEKKATASKAEVNAIGSTMNNTIRMINAMTGTNIAQLPHHQTPNGIEVIDDDAVLQDWWSQTKAAFSNLIRSAGKQ